MQYQAPIIDVAGDKFALDYPQAMLRLVDDERKYLRFIGMEFPGKEGYHRFLYDTKNKEIYYPTEPVNKLPAEVVYAELPTMDLLDRAGAGKKAGLNDHEIANAVLEENLVEKSARLLPKATFMGDEFFVDFRRMVFVDSLNISNKISFQDANQASDGRIFIDYDFNNRKVADPNSPDYSDDTTAVVILKPYKDLDPEGWEIAQITGALARLVRDGGRQGNRPVRKRNTPKNRPGKGKKP